jgi:E3 ubiquitin-protein ligase TRIP12
MDFFAIGLQRTAVLTAANICRVVNTGDFALVADSLPILGNLVSHTVRTHVLFVS